MNQGSRPPLDALFLGIRLANIHLGNLFDISINSWQSSIDLTVFQLIIFACI
jgi:hypothetical protein